MVNLDAAYLVLPGGKSRITGHFYLASLPNRRNYNNATNNTPVLTGCKTLKHDICSAVKTEFASLFHNGPTTIAIQN
eukprot:10724141-Ditylum_brightwellii.AAC.2